MCTTTRRPVLFSVLACLAALLTAAPSGAQGPDPYQDASTNKGLHGSRSYFSPEPWEHFDTLSGNIVLTFTDLVLPGNAGRELRIQRTYNNQDSALSYSTLAPERNANSRWQFGLAGMVMRVVEQEAPANMQHFRFSWGPPTNTTPIFVMADGSRVYTTYVNDYTAAGANPPTMEVVSAQFYKYDRVNRVLRMPNGTTSYYDAATGRLISFHDQFGNLVELHYVEGGVLITQHVGDEQREILLAMDNVGRITNMGYAGRTWTYDYDVPGSPTENQIVRVETPEGLEWRFEYDTFVSRFPFEVTGYETRGLVAITTPNKGIVRYGYTETQVWASNSIDSQWRRYLTARQAEGPRGTATGTWQIIQFALGLEYDVFVSVQTEIITPSGARVGYRHGTTTAVPYQSLTGALGVTSRGVTSGTDVALEGEDTSYTDLKVVGYGRAVVPTLLRQTISRDGRAFTKTFSYSSSNFGDYHRPQRVVESGHSSRTTNYTYLHLPGAWILGLPASETVQTSNSNAMRRMWTYDALGFKTSDVGWHAPTAAGGVTTTYTRDPLGNVASASVSGRPATTFEYEFGRPKQVLTPLTSVSRVINPDGTIASETAGGRTTTFQYDGLMRQTVMTPPGGGNATITEFDNVDGATVTQRQGTSFVTTTLDGFGKVVESIDSHGVRTRTEYDAEARVRFKSAPFDTSHPEVRVEIRYDVLDRVVRMINPDNTFSSRTYGDGWMDTTDALGRTTRLYLNGFGHPDDAILRQVVEATSATWNYQYNILGALTRVTSPDNRQRNWRYDALNRLDQEVHPETGTTTFTYDAAAKHLLASRTDANGSVTSYFYDNNDRVTRLSVAGQDTTTTYEAGSDNIATLTNASVATTYGYDGAGRLASRQDVIGASTFASSYLYDSNGNVREVTYPSGRKVGYTHNSGNDIVRVFDAATLSDYAFNMTYHPSGALESYTAGNQLPTTITRDPLRHRVQSISSGPLQLGYTSYDAVGNVRTITDARAGYDQTFGYDALHRLTSASGQYGAIAYQYNAHGNRTNANGTTYAYDSTTLRLRSQGAINFTYDNNGNTRTAGAATYTYTPTNMLATVTALGHSAQYVYDAGDQRIQETVDGVPTVSLRGLGGELLSEMVLAGTEQKYSDYIYAGPHLLAVASRGAATAQQVIDFESGASLSALGFVDIIDSSNQSGQGLGGSTWGVRGNPGETASAKYYAEASLPVTSTTREFEFEAEFDHADSAYSRFGFSAFEMRWRENPQNQFGYAPWFMSLYHGYGETATERDRLVLYLGGDELISGPGVIVPGTTQRITVRGSLSTVTNFDINADGSIEVLVDGALVFSLTGIELGLSGSWTGVENGIAGWNILMFNPMGRFDNLRIGAAADTVHYYHADAIGSVRAITDDNGQLVSRLDYLPFGEPWNQGTSTEPIRFAGKEFDSESGLQYFGARHYASGTGRFISADPLQGRLADPQSFNRYAYARNNPLRFIDPTGLYEVDAACLADKVCTAEADAFEKERQRALLSKNADVANAARAYGDPGVANGVTLHFGNQKTLDAACGSKGAAGCVPNPGYIGVPATGGMNPDVRVFIKTGLKGMDLQRTVVHEGSHVNDALDFVRSWDLASISFDAAKNLTIGASELKAYRVETFVDPSTKHPLSGALPVQTDMLINAFLKKSPNYAPHLNKFMFSTQFAKPR